jgi:tetratricopeptide (TPR) repeat protein
MAARILKNHDLATGHYLAARGLGLSTEELSSGADYLISRSLIAITASGEAEIKGDLEVAEQHLEKALLLDPYSLNALDYLGNLRFRLKDYDGAVIAWEVLVDYEKAAGESQLSASHMNLARALVLAKRSQEAQAPLRDYLEAYPDGLHATDTREMVKHLPVQ